jgi:platelet-activating factor acetylhydrolase
MIRILGRRSCRNVSVVVIFGTFCLFFLAKTMSPLSNPLPNYSGPHHVGIIDLEADVETRVLHEAVLRETGEVALKVRYYSFLHF